MRPGRRPDPLLEPRGYAAEQAPRLTLALSPAGQQITPCGALKLEPLRHGQPFQLRRAGIREDGELGLLPGVGQVQADAARANERTLSGEVRRALQEHLARLEQRSAEAA
jgi:hypothetical protein